MSALGKHILAEFFDCNSEILNNRDKIETYLKRAALECGATIVNSVFHSFNPHGVSGVVVIAESHLAIHTWPEYNYAAIDVFTCGETVNPWEATRVLKEYLQSQKVVTVELRRGELSVDRVLPFKPALVHEFSE